jgi:hypothetical protein
VAYWRHVLGVADPIGGSHTRCLWHEATGAPTRRLDAAALAALGRGRSRGGWTSRCRTRSGCSLQLAPQRSPMNLGHAFIRPGVPRLAQTTSPKAGILVDVADSTVFAHSADTYKFW